MHVVATAGHVDHGKSALVQALTGIDPDRLAEEKRRGLTIDLGFAWLKLPSGREVGVVDVPGHERFIRNMLAGVGAVNATIFVVAADEGWMPQSQEHLDILDLLRVPACVVAITKADLVHKHDLGDRKSQIEARLGGTSLEGSEIVAVSARTQLGLDTLIAALERLLEKAPAAENRGRARLWIDRCFSMKGSGTVVTGTLVDGRIESGAEVEILPGGMRARVRSVQSHRRQVLAVEPGNRTALNLAGIGTDDVERGDAVVAPGAWMTSVKFGAELRFLPHLTHDPTERGSFKLYLGSAEVDAQPRFLDPIGEERVLTVVDLRRPLPVAFGDHFVLRDSGRRETVGGGTVLEPDVNPGQSRKQTTAALRARMGLDPPGYLARIVEERGYIPETEALRRVGPLAALRTVRSLGGYHVSEFAHATWSTRLLASIRSHQAAHPLDAGLFRTEARLGLALPGRLFDALIDDLEKDQLIMADAEVVRTPDHRPAIDSSLRASLLEVAGGASPPMLEDLRRRFGPDLVAAVVRAGDMVQVSGDLAYVAGWLEEIKSKILVEITRNGPMTVARFRDVAGTTRKYAVPLLEYLDSIGWTRRQRDARVLGSRVPPG